ncbi:MULTISPECIES: 5-carboxymethyl-2-hydroxymuconate Delta-isomerase [unclassified Acinetobacter]|uniref:5-carboxymethyl-2-hydroxymuconate Delta-isomerase n=1 Tax=unclassified Acinetobacter TaxID=196816 RepID=UPI0035B81ADC
MPHLIIETSHNLDYSAQDLLLCLNQALVSTGHFQAIDIKSRIVKIDASLVGTGEQAQAFIALQLFIMKGRDQATQQSFAQTLCDALQQFFKTNQGLQCSVEVIELSTVYQKCIV